MYLFNPFDVELIFKKLMNLCTTSLITGITISLLFQDIIISMDKKIDSIMKKVERLEDHLKKLEAPTSVPEVCCNQH